MSYKNKLVFSSLSFLILIIVSCRSTKVTQTTFSNDIAPNASRISGMIINIEPISESTGPCSIHPCIATVNINNVIGYGSSFKTTIAKGDKIKLEFAFTLSETSKELFPALEISLPGLKLGDIFTGDIEKIELLQFDTKSPQIVYRIFNYKKID